MFDCPIEVRTMKNVLLCNYCRSRSRCMDLIRFTTHLNKNFGKGETETLLQKGSSAWSESHGCFLLFVSFSRSKPSQDLVLFYMPLEYGSTTSRVILVSEKYLCSDPKDLELKLKQDLDLDLDLFFFFFFVNNVSFETNLILL